MNTHDYHRLSDLDRTLSGEPRREADRLRDVWRLASGEADGDAPDPRAVERVWNTLEAFIDAREHTNNVPTAGRESGRRGADGPPAQAREATRNGFSALYRLTPRSWMAVAATLLVGAAIGLLTLWFRPVVETAAPGQRLAVTLPDGSRIDLNSGTTVRYARRFGQDRVVHLEGEAFFDVAPEARPFVVHTFNARVTVLGTRFNVRAWSRSIDPATTVALASGRVALAPADKPDQTVTLAPGQTHRIARDAHEPGPADAEAVARATAWRHGDLVSRDQRLGVILEDVERRFAVGVALEPPSLRETPMTVVLRNPESVETALRDVCVALGLRYRETSNGYELYASP